MTARWTGHTEIPIHDAVKTANDFRARIVPVWRAVAVSGMDRCFYLRHAAGAFTLNVLFKLMARISRRYALAVRQSPRLGSGGWPLRPW